MIVESAQTGTAHLILMDIGNTNVAMATWSDEHRGEVESIPTASFDQLMAHVEGLWSALPANTNRAVIICSVCPPVLARLREACAARGIKPLLVVGQEIEPPITIDTELLEPSRVGTDRLCAAAGAFAKIKAACVVADFGTALTIDLVADNGVFLGGDVQLVCDDQPVQAEIGNHLVHELGAAGDVGGVASGDDQRGPFADVGGIALGDLA